jgi:hypothetical protein
MPCWYQLSTEFDLRPEALADGEFATLVSELEEYVGNDGDILITQDGGLRFSANIEGTFTIHGPAKIDGWIQKLGAFAVTSAMVRSHIGGDDDIYFIGLSEEAKRKAEIEYHLEAIREHVDALKIEEDPMYDEGPLPVDDVVNAIRALVENRNTLVVGSYPDEQRIDVSFVVVGSCRSDAKELIDDIQDALDDVEEIAESCPETIASNVFMAAAYYTARDLFNLAARLLQEPDVRRKSSTFPERAEAGHE